MPNTTTDPDWPALLEGWDRQQEIYVPDRDELIGRMLDVTEAAVGAAPLVLDLGGGPGAISGRLLNRLPEARAVAVDIDPLLMAMGQATLGDMDGRLRWVRADLRASDWTEALGGEPFDAALSTTALHWLLPERLVGMYRSLADVLRPGGILLNAEGLGFDERSSTCRAVAATLRERQRSAALTAEGACDWDAWWQALAGHPTLDALLEERNRLFAHGTHLERRDVARFQTPRQFTRPSLAFHVGALAEAGFREIETVWQDLERRLLMAVR